MSEGQSDGDCVEESRRGERWAPGSSGAAVWFAVSTNLTHTRSRTLFVVSVLYHCITGR